MIKNSDKCNAVFLADTVPALIALDAKLKILKKGETRTIHLKEFYNSSGHPANLISADEIIAEIHIPEAPPKSFSMFFKDAPREVGDFALVNMALVISFQEGDGFCKDARIAVGGVTSFPFRSTQGEDALIGEKISEEIMNEVEDLVVKDSAPISPIWISPNQRRHKIRAFVKRGLRAALAYREKIELSKPNAVPNIS